jgi:putative transposase
VTATAERLDQLLHRPLGEQRWLVVFLDGFGMGEHLLVGALGVAADGTKVPLGGGRRHHREHRGLHPADDRAA